MISPTGSPTGPSMSSPSGMMRRQPTLGSLGARPKPVPSNTPMEPAQGLAPSGGMVNKALVNTPPEGPSTQGYGKAAMPSLPSLPKLEPTGGAQMGATNTVGSGGSMNPRSGMMGGMARSSFGNMGSPGTSFQPQTNLEQGMKPGFDMNQPAQSDLSSNPDYVGGPNRILSNLGGGSILNNYRNRGTAAGQDMSWMNNPGAIQMGPSSQMPPPGDTQPAGGLGPSPNQPQFSALAQKLGNINNMRTRMRAPMQMNPMNEMQ
jgi:hypothetical protein